MKKDTLLLQSSSACVSCTLIISLATIAVSYFTANINSAITDHNHMGELYFGFENGNRKAQNNTRLDRFIRTGRVEILHIDVVTARVFGELFTELMRLGKTIQQDDVWIAALCKQHSYTLATADKGFRHIVGLDTVEFTP